jgi:hypothetical protein
MEHGRTRRMIHRMALLWGLDPLSVFLAEYVTDGLTSEIDPTLGRTWGTIRAWRNAILSLDQIMYQAHAAKRRLAPTFVCGLGGPLTNRPNNLLTREEAST